MKKKLSIIIGGEDFEREERENYLKNFVETVLNNCENKLEIQGFEGVAYMRDFEKELIHKISARDKYYLRSADEINLTYTIIKKKYRKK